MGKSKKEKRQAYFFDNKTLLALILPLVVEQLLAVLVGMADSIMIASVGEAAVSGVSLVDQIMVLLINAFSALATGGAVVAGQFLGQDRREESCKSATQMVWFITICAIGITVLVYLGKIFYFTYSIWKNRPGCDASCRHLPADRGGIDSIHGTV